MFTMPVADGSSASEIEVENGEAGFDNRRPSITMVTTITVAVKAFHNRALNFSFNYYENNYVVVVNATFPCLFVIELRIFPFEFKLRQRF